MAFNKKTMLLCEALSQEKEVPDETLNSGKIYNGSNRISYLVMSYSEKDVSELVSVNNGAVITVKQRLPVGYICRTISNIIGNNNKTPEYAYDIHCSSLMPREMEHGTFKGFVVRFSNCEVTQGRVDGIESYHLHPPGLHLKIENVVQVSDVRVTLQEFISDKVVGGLVDCWATPVKTTDGSAEWVVVPTDELPRPFFIYAKVYDKMVKMFTHTGFGVVVGVGKIAIRRVGIKYGRLVNCPMHFELGSTRVCVYNRTDVNGYKMTLLVKSKPVKLKRRYMETFVTPNGSVLIKTIAGKPSVPKLNIAEPPSRTHHNNPSVSSTVAEPMFNYCDHPFFGKLIFSSQMIWSAPTIKVLIGGSINSTCHLLSSELKVDDFFMLYHVLGFHDGERYWRVPDVPDEMFDSKNYLIQNGVPMWGESPDAVGELHAPPVLAEAFIEGRYLSNQFIKHPEVEFESLSDSEDEEEFVLDGWSQTPPQRKLFNN